MQNGTKWLESDVRPGRGAGSGDGTTQTEGAGCLSDVRDVDDAVEVQAFRSLAADGAT